MTDQNLAVAVIGAGQWGINHVREFAELGVLAHVVDPDPINRERVIDRWPAVAVSESIEPILDDAAIGGVIIAAPAPLHCSIAAQALRAGKDVLVEKPLALTVADGRMLCELAEDEDRILMVGHLLQYHPIFCAVVERAQQSDFGPIRQIWSHRKQFGRFRSEENALWSLAPHDVSMVNRLFGAAPTALDVVASRSVSSQLADNVFLGLDYANGLSGHVHVSWHHPYKEHRLVVAGEEQMVVFDDALPWPQKLAIYAHRIDWSGGTPKADKCDKPSYLAVEQSQPLVNECQHFLDCMATRQRPLTDGREGLAVLQVLATAQQQLEAKGLY
ncbi:Gfo/Idh/MocA family oxidoreductase [Gammaproteobacteria bacterium]|nr:Gfo/Idh/MocA family oxidoreductase [Gammaproteobacteria bacterium]